MFVVPESKRLVQEGDRFERLTVVGVPFYGAYHAQSVVCLCDCGNHAIARVAGLRIGDNKSCGCLQLEKAIASKYKHGMHKTRLYRIWQGIRDRCENGRKEKHRHYFGRGIVVCDEWQDFASFAEWSESSGYSDRLEIDRIDNDGNYEPTNCRWVTRRQQCNNRRITKYVTAFGETKPLADWSRDIRCKVSYNVLNARIRLGVMTPEEAIETPKQPNGVNRGRRKCG